MKANSSQFHRLVGQLDLDQLDSDLFLGDSGPGEGRLFGGMVAAQAVVAAYRTVPEGTIHSLHSYFLRGGKHVTPIRYAVYRIRDGRTFTTRDVVAYQSGEAIFNLSASFTKPEEGVSHQGLMPDVPGPEGLKDWERIRPDRYDDPDRIERRISGAALEFRGIPPEEPREGETPRQNIWLRLRGALPDDPVLHAALLTYASDRSLLSTARVAHAVPRTRRTTASLDHAIWFHHPPRFDSWILYSQESPVAHAARALVVGQMWRPDGLHVATVVQEGLIRTART